jgi:ABC-type glycerol-3-phosphate transport system substrate-binding protein
MANNTAMLTGAACFIVNIPTIANALKTNAPDIYENTGAVPMPAGPEGSFPLAGPSLLGVFAHSESEDYWTQQAIAYMLDPDYYNTLIGLVAPAYAGVYKDFVPTDPYAVALVDALANAKLYQYPNDIMTTGHAAIITREFMVNNFVAYHLVDGLSFDEALDKWAGELQAEMDRVG